jgi:hypothetical protein
VGNRNKYDDPDYSGYVPTDVWTEVLPRLWMGGTDDDDILGYELEEPRITLANFDTVVTLHAWSNPADWHVREIRQGFHDGELSEVDFDDVMFLATQVYREWQAGRRVLIRCLSGLNRSGLVTALVMIMAGYEPDVAISHLRSKRSRNVLCNADFAQWILEVDPENLKGISL